MKIINNLKDLDKVIQLCRKRGVDTIKIDGIEVQLGMAPIKEDSTKQATRSVPSQTFAPGGITEDTKIPADTLTEEELLFWSASDPTQQ